MTQAYVVDVEITAPVNSTERTERVAEAITNLFPDAEPEERAGELTATTHSLAQFSELLHRYEILDTARSVFYKNRRGERTAFDLKKQAAYVGRVNFAVGDPAELGDIHVRVKVDKPDFDAVVDQVAPPTEDGQPVTPDE